MGAVPANRHQAGPGTGLGRAKDWMGRGTQTAQWPAARPLASCLLAQAPPRLLLAASAGSGYEPAPLLLSAQKPLHTGQGSPRLPFLLCPRRALGQEHRLLPPGPAGMTAPGARHRQAWTQAGVTSPPACDLRSPGQRLRCCRPATPCSLRLQSADCLPAHGSSGAPVRGEPGQEGQPPPAGAHQPPPQQACEVTRVHRVAPTPKPPPRTLSLYLFIRR